MTYTAHSPGYHQGPRGVIEVTATLIGSEGHRTFDTGAIRDISDAKLDYDGFLSPLVLKRYAEHMHTFRKLPDGSSRTSDNWQLGIPKDEYLKSMFRHFVAVWSSHRGVSNESDIAAELCALLFNVSGYLHEHLKAEHRLERSGI